MDQHDEEPIYFNHSAPLRIFGDIADLDGISASLGLSPTHTHRAGDKTSLSKHAKAYENDMWTFSPDVPKDAAIENHIDTLWRHIESNREYLLELKKTLTVDVFIGYRSNCDNAGIDIPHESLAMFSDLEIPLRLSIIVA